MGEYHGKELRRVLDAGPEEGDTFFRVKVMGAEQTKWLNVTTAQIEAIAAIMEGGSRFTLTIDQLGNAAFEGEDMLYEIARILGEGSTMVSGGYTNGSLRDGNGNTVGKFELTED